MNAEFNISAEYAVESCGYNFYRNPLVHPSRVLPWHVLFMVLEGSWEIWQDGERCTLCAGDVIVMPSGHRHYGKIPCAPGTRTVFFHCYRAPGCSPSPEGPFITLDSVIHCTGHPHTSQLFDEITSNFRAPESGVRSVILSSLVRQTLCELYNVQNKVELTDRAMAAALNYLRANQTRFISGSELAEQTFLSERALRTRFRATFGQSLHQYQMSEKLQRVRDTLVYYPEMTLREIADSYGFYDEFHLSKAFKSKYGESPSEFKKQNVTRSGGDTGGGL